MAINQLKMFEVQKAEPKIDWSKLIKSLAKELYTSKKFNISKRTDKDKVSIEVINEKLLKPDGTEWWNKSI